MRRVRQCPKALPGSVGGAGAGVSRTLGRTRPPSIQRARGRRPLSRRRWPVPSSLGGLNRPRGGTVAPTPTHAMKPPAGTGRVSVWPLSPDPGVPCTLAPPGLRLGPKNSLVTGAPGMGESASPGPRPL